MLLSQSCKNKTVLLIDDDEDDCYLFSKAVSEINPDLEVECIHSSDNLLLALETCQPSIIFIDLHLPKQNGLSCLRFIRSLPAYKNVPVIFWSGSCDARNKTSAYSEGAQYYFEKPHCINTLNEELTSIFNRYWIAAKPVYGGATGKIVHRYLASC